MEETAFLQKHLGEVDRNMREAKECRRNGDVTSAKRYEGQAFLSGREAQKAISYRIKKNNSI